MRSATVGWPARRSDSVLPAQSWNSSQTRIGLASSSTAAAIAGPAVSGSPRTAAIDAQNVRKSRREMPLSVRSSPSVGPIIATPRQVDDPASVQILPHRPHERLPLVREERIADPAQLTAHLVRRHWALRRCGIRVSRCSAI